MLRYKNIYAIPSFHGRVNFANELQKIFYKVKPDAIVVELPEAIKLNVIEGVKRLPKYSVVIYKDLDPEIYLFTPVDPCDSMIEGVRLALENNISFYFVDLYVDLQSKQEEARIMPDDQAIREIGLDKMYELYEEALMAEEVKQNNGSENLSAINDSGESIIDGDKIRESINEGDKIRERINKGDKNGKSGKDISKINEYSDLDISEYHFPSFFLKKDFIDQDEINEKIINKYKDNKQGSLIMDDSANAAREYYMAAHLQDLMKDHKKILFVCGFVHWFKIKRYLQQGVITSVLQYKPDIESELFNVAPKDVYRFCTEVPYFVYQWENFRERAVEYYKNNTNNDSQQSLPDFDRYNYIPFIFLKAIKEYRKRYDEPLNRHQLIHLKQYLQNLAFFDGRFTPDVYHMIAAAQGIADDDFAWYVYKVAHYYPYAVKKDDNISTLSTEGDFFKFNEKKVRLYRSIPIKSRKHSIRLRKVREEKKGENWKKTWDNSLIGICSWPEEDIVLEEGYGTIRRIGLRTLTQQFTKIHRFEGSLYDGIDIRETLRNWVNGEHIYVKEIKRIRGTITDFVIIFDDEPLPPYLLEDSQGIRDFSNFNGPEGEKYPYTISFWAEHSNESDLAFYSTTPGKYMVGPGITVVKLGGLHAVFPPISQQEGEFFWNAFEPSFNYLYKMCKYKSERLLVNAIYQTKGKYILFIARKRPRPIFYEMVSKSRRNLSIVFVPMSGFSPSTIQRIKYMHILASKKVREYADKYIDLKRKFRF